MGTDTAISTDCQVPDYGYPTQDGYLRYLTKPRKLGGKLKMLHRIEWEKHKGEIPVGYEIGHTCKNRKCVNIDHLECLPISVHRAKNNHLRYYQREQELLAYVRRNPTKSQKAVGELFGVTQAAVSKILQRNRYSEIH